LVNNITNCGYGQYNEDTAINIYSNMTNTIITDQQKKIIAHVKTIQIKNKTIEWNLIGKIDGIATNTNGQQILIEIKNRVNTLFNHLKDYEKPQIQAYMKLTGFKQAHLVEHITNDTGIISVEYDSKYWKHVKDRLHKFLDFFTDFVNDEKMQELLLLDGQYNDIIDLHFRKLLESYF
jgi:predicted ribosome quality control (RQC) complex YloA/Tae2 family protein